MRPIVRGTAEPSPTLPERVRRDLVEVFAGPDPAPTWRRRSAVEIWAMSTVLGVVGLFLVERHGGPQTSALLAIVSVTPLPLAVRYPLMGWRIGWLAFLITPWVSESVGPRYYPWTQLQLAVLIVAVFVAGWRHRRPILGWIWALTLVPFCWRIAFFPGPDRQNNAVVAAGLTVLVIAVDVWRSRSQVATALAEQAELTDLEKARRAVLEERARIAREMHDVVAHHMSLIAVRAETAPYRLAELPEPVREEFVALSAAAREAMTDMRRLLGVLRDDRPVELAPQPQLSDVPALVDAAREAGVTVSLTLPPLPERIPDGVGVCAYRIVQESLSNAGRHAPGAAVAVAVSVAVEGDKGAVRLRVSNGPSGTSTRSVSLFGGGHGLAGMRERVALLGGTLSAGPDARGGFVVSAELPVEGAA